MKEIAMKIINEEGKEIVKGVPENLVSEYEAIGWAIVGKESKPAEKEIKPIAKNNKLED